MAKRYNIVTELTDLIVRKKLPVGFQLESSSVLAEQYGVSEKTVHRAMAKLAARGVIRRIRGSGSFVNNNVVFEKRLRIGVFLFHYSEPIPILNELAFGNIYREIIRLLTEAGHCVECILNNTPYELEDNKEIFWTLKKFDIVIMAAGYLPLVEKYLRDTPLKTILIMDDTIHYGNYQQIIFDYRPGFIKALKYLQERQFKQCFVGGMQNLVTSERRFQALLDAASIIGFPLKNIHYYAGIPNALHMATVAGQDCAHYFLTHYNITTPIIALSDFLTIGIVDVLVQKKLPLDQFTIISYDNIIRHLPNGEIYKQFCSITHPFDQLPRQIIEMVEDLSRKQNQITDVRIIPANEFTENIKRTVRNN